jgi:AcrR family transcriptional regulator
MAKRDTSKTKDKIIEAAFDLFYNQGYQATTVDQVIEKSGVSRPTLYTHFSTKEDLCRAYLSERKTRDLTAFKEAMRRESNPRDRYLVVIREVGKALWSTEYRGCGFFNIISEVADPAHPLFREARQFVDAFRELIRDGVAELKASDPRYGKIDVDEVAESYYVLVGGAIMVSQEYREKWPVERAIRAIETLIEN